MVRLHLESAEIGSDGPCRFKFQILQDDGAGASLDLSVRQVPSPNGMPDVVQAYAAARAELVSTLLQALIEANRLDDSLTPRRALDLPNSGTLRDLRRSAPANDDRRSFAFRAGGTS